jgi:exodeoxyribonuclease VII large subunit
MEKQLRLEQLVAVVWSWFRTLFEEFEFWCTAEIADLKPFKSRLYLDLIEANESWAILAKAKWIIREPSVMQKFMKTAWVRRSELVWMTILFRWNCTFHEKYWWSISIKEISSEYTRGKQVTHRDTVIQQLKEQWIRQLNKETLLAAKPLRLAVVTWRGSAWYEDFKSILDESWYHTIVTPFWSAVHGNQALEEVPQHLHAIYTQLKADATVYDAVLLVRWGGGKDGFLWQDDHTIAKFVSAIPVPVIVAVWHTRDSTLLDLNCRYAAKTPSEAATKLIDHMRIVQEDIENRYIRISELLESKKVAYMEWIHALYENIQLEIQNRYTTKTASIEDLYQKILHYNPYIQLEHGYSLVTNEEGKVVSWTLEPWKEYQLYHGAQKYVIVVKK